MSKAKVMLKPQQRSIGMLIRTGLVLALVMVVLTGCGAGWPQLSQGPSLYTSPRYGGGLHVDPDSAAMRKADGWR
jgi:hypothetical protein